ELTIYTADDLVGVIGNELIGVHQFETLTVTGGAKVDFGEDRLVIIDEVNSSIDAGSRLTVAQADETFVKNMLHNNGELEITEAVTFNSLELSDITSGQLVAPSLTVLGDMTISNSSVELLVALPLTVPGDMTLSNSSVKLVAPLEVGGDMTLESSTLGSQVGDKTTGDIYPLDINVTGLLSIDLGSALDVSGQGYPGSNGSPYYGGPDFGTDPILCHGGIRANITEDCTYGRYQWARFAGSGGYYYNSSSNGAGGGIVSIIANSVQLDGAIRADGLLGYYYGGSGGSIHLDVKTLSGQGELSASGGNMYTSSWSYSAGTGGRISIYAEDRTGFTGSYLAASEDNNIAGAGTVYLQDPVESYGHLVVDNDGNIANDNSTPIRSVGRHTITNVEEVESGVWRIEVADEPWRPSDAMYDWGLDGISVDLDASEDSSALYVIETNTANELTIYTADDLVGVIGNELIGVHQFETLTVTGGAKVDFGEDRLVIIDE
ncbi:MAG: hypothetical protein GY814_15755, partial [Gammaproteobacteria bacterium]|nr:hypothetical protein [Gammaproteobacteria bacterium]